MKGQRVNISGVAVQFHHSTPLCRHLVNAVLCSVYVSMQLCPNQAGYTTEAVATLGPSAVVCQASSRWLIFDQLCLFFIIIQFLWWDLFGHLCFYLPRPFFCSLVSPCFTASFQATLEFLIGILKKSVYYFVIFITSVCFGLLLMLFFS